MNMYIHIHTNPHTYTHTEHSGEARGADNNDEGEADEERANNARQHHVEAPARGNPESKGQVALDTQRNGRQVWRSGGWFVGVGVCARVHAHLRMHACTPCPRMHARTHAHTHTHARTHAHTHTRATEGEFRDGIQNDKPDDSLAYGVLDVQVESHLGVQHTCVHTFQTHALDVYHAYVEAEGDRR